MLYTCAPNCLLMSSAAALRAAGSGFDEMMSKALSITGSLKRPKLSASWPIGEDAVLYHHVRCSSGSLPKWLRQPNAWNVPLRARPMYWPCSIGVIVAFTLSPKASCHIEMTSWLLSTLNGSFVVL